LLVFFSFFLFYFIGGKKRERERDGGRDGRDRSRDRDDRRFQRKSGPQPDDICFNCRNPGHW
jgi:hypothetical protein